MNKLVNFLDRIFGFAPHCTVEYDGKISEFCTLEEARFYYRNVIAMDHSRHVEVRDSKERVLYFRSAVSTR